MNLNEILRKQTSKRKLRLFSVACCNEILHLIKDKQGLQAVKIAELYTDNLATEEQLRAAYDAADAITINAAAYAAADTAYHLFTAAEAEYVADAAAHAIASAVTSTTYEGVAAAFATANIAAKEKHLKIAEDIFESTNLTVAQSPLILTIAQSIYEDKCWSDMPILADALEDNACKNKQILDHLRSNELHVRGCWVLDLILGKE